MTTYEFLQHYWWFIISLLGGLLSFLLFVQGGQSMIFSLSKTEDEKKILVNVLGRKWSFTFTTLVVFGGAFFASFPLFYSTSFGGAFWVWMIILFAFTIQAFSYEFQSKPGNIYGINTYRTLLFINGLLGTFLIGVAVATFFTGSDFTVGKGNIANIGSPIISRWGNPWHGLEALLCPRNLFLGFTMFFLARTQALLFFINRIKHESLEKRSHKFLLYNAIPFVVFFLAFVISIFLSKGFAVHADGTVDLEPYKYFFNLIEMPFIGILFVLGVLSVLFGIIYSLIKTAYRQGIWFSGVGTVVVVTMLLLITGYNNTAFYPSTADHQSSLTIFNASSSEFTLKAMSWASILVPIVLTYIFIAWRALEKKRTDLADVTEDENAY